MRQKVELSKPARKKLLGCITSILIVFGLLQFVPVSWPEPANGQELPAPPQVRQILRTHCYDCHSSRSERPWYAHVAPLSWWISYDVNQGVSRLDFSNWDAESPTSARYKIAHSGHRVRKGAAKPGDALMPPASYLWFHPDAHLSETEREQLFEWAGEHGMKLDGSDQRLAAQGPFSKARLELPGPRPIR